MSTINQQLVKTSAGLVGTAPLQMTASPPPAPPERKNSLSGRAKAGSIGSPVPIPVQRGASSLKLNLPEPKQEVKVDPVPTPAPKAPAPSKGTVPGYAASTALSKVRKKDPVRKHEVELPAQTSIPGGAKKVEAKPSPQQPIVLKGGGKGTPPAQSAPMPAQNGAAASSTPVAITPPQNGTIAAAAKPVAVAQPVAQPKPPQPASAPAQNGTIAAAAKPIAVAQPAAQSKPPQAAAQNGAGVVAKYAPAGQSQLAPLKPIATQRTGKEEVGEKTPVRGALNEAPTSARSSSVREGDPTTPKRSSARVAFAAPELKRRSSKDSGGSDDSLGRQFDFSRFGFGGDVLEMMRADLRAAKEGKPVDLFMEGPTIPPEPVAVGKPAKQRVVMDDVINATILNTIFFNPKRSDVDLPSYEEGGAIIPLNPIYPTPEEIRDFEFSDLDKEAVKRLSFFSCNIGDEQIEQLIRKFPNIETVSFFICPELTNETLLLLSQLKKLKSIMIRSCPGMTSEGVDSLSAISMDHLEEFGITTGAMIDASKFLNQLAQAPHLRQVDFSICSNLTPNGFLCFKNAPQDKHLEIRIMGCPEITEETVEELNQGRSLPITVIWSKEDLKEHYVNELFRCPEPPPEFPPEEETFSDTFYNEAARKIEDLPDSAEKREFLEGYKQVLEKEILPDPSVMEHVAATFPQFFKGIERLSLTGPVKDDQLGKLIDIFSSPSSESPIQALRIYDCPEITRTGIISLRQLKNLRTLYVGKCPKVPTRGLEILFDTVFQSLEEVNLAGMPITNHVLHSLAQFPKIRSVDLSFCDKITWNGLKQFLETPSLEYLCLKGCKRIDPFAVEEFRQRRPQVNLDADRYIPDPSIKSMVLKEAERILKWSNHPKHYVFILEILKVRKEPIPENELNALDEMLVKEANPFYSRKLAEFGFYLHDLHIKEMALEHWLYADLILQSLKNTLRLTHEIVEHLIEVGFFTDQDKKEMAPLTIYELLQYLERKDERGINPYTHKMQVLNFSGITHVPEFVYVRTWDQVKKVIYDEAMGHYPKELLSQLPSLDIDEMVQSSAKWLKSPVVDFSECPKLTWQGLKALLHAMPLKILALENCRALSPFDLEEFRRKRPDVTLKTDVKAEDELQKRIPIHRSLVDVAKAEASEIPETFEYCFLEEANYGSEQAVPAEKEIEVGAFYLKKFKQFGIEPADLEITPAKKDWKKADYLLQVLRNICRFSCAIVKHLPREHSVATQESLALALKEVGNIELLNLSHLGLTSIPAVFWSSEVKWLRLKEVNLAGNPLKHLPEGFWNQCPKLFKERVPSSSSSWRDTLRRFWSKKEAKG